MFIIMRVDVYIFTHITSSPVTGETLNEFSKTKVLPGPLNFSMLESSGFQTIISESPGEPIKIWIAQNNARVSDSVGLGRGLGISVSFQVMLLMWRLHFEKQSFRASPIVQPLLLLQFVL